MYMIINNLNGGYFANKIGNFPISKADQERIESYVIESAEPIILVADLMDLEQIGIDRDEIEII